MLIAAPLRFARHQPRRGIVGALRRGSLTSYSLQGSGSSRSANDLTAADLHEYLDAIAGFTSRIRGADGSAVDARFDRGIRASRNGPWLRRQSLVWIWNTASYLEFDTNCERRRLTVI